MDKDDQKEGLFKRLKNIENAQKNLIRDCDNESIYYTPRSEFDDKDKKQQTNNRDTKPWDVFNYLKNLSQEANDLMDEIKVDDDDIDKNNLLFIGSNNETFDFSTFDMQLNFLLNIYNAKTSLKETELKKNKIEGLQFNYESKNKKEKEKINAVLMHAKDLLEYRNEIIKAFKDGTFRSEHLKEVDDAAHKYMLKDADTFIEKIRSMEEKVNLSLFEEFFDHSSPADYAKILINTKNAGENKENIEVIGDRILALKDRIERMSEKEKKRKLWMRH